MAKQIKGSLATRTGRLDAFIDEIRTEINAIAPTDVKVGAPISRSHLWGFVEGKNNVSIEVMRRLTVYLDSLHGG